MKSRITNIEVGDRFMDIDFQNPQNGKVIEADIYEFTGLMESGMRIRYDNETKSVVFGKKLATTEEE